MAASPDDVPPGGIPPKSLRFRVGDTVVIVGGREVGRTGVVTAVNPRSRGSRVYTVRISESLFTHCKESELEPTPAEE